MRTVITSLLTVCALATLAAELPKAPIPPSPYLPIVYKFADAMLERGRTTNGLFYSALDRVSLEPLSNRWPVISNPQHDENFLRLLYTLSELSGKPKYRDAADAALRWYFEHVAVSTNALVPWGISWDVTRARAIAAPHISGLMVDQNRPWMLWDRCFALAPEASARIAQGLTEHRKYVPRQAGFYIRAWASAYAHTGRKEFLKAIETALMHFENDPTAPDDFAAARSLKGAFTPMLSMAIDCDAASRVVPAPLAQQLRDFAARQDQGFCRLEHDVQRTGGFISFVDYMTRVIRETRTLPWTVRIGTTAQVGMMCVSRYENGGDVRYRDLIHGAADCYLTALPDKDRDWSPMTFGQAISLQVAAWRSTARQEYLDGARALADFAVKHFFDHGPLPRASLKRDHYEAITGADTLALGLVELHLHILAITAVRYPPNTIDR